MEAAASPELRLAVQCCAYNFTASEREPPTPDRLIDWRLFVELIEFHGVAGLASAALSAASADIPRWVSDWLKSSARAIAIQNLQACAQSRRLLESFQAAGEPLLFLKGLSLGKLAYSNPALKAAIDLDILVAPTALSTAATILTELRFELVAPAPSSDSALNRWHRRWKESVWIHHEADVQLDLHTQAADNNRLIASVDVHSPLQHVSVSPGIELPTLADEQLFAYLAVHGASSAWFRLKWISDFAGFLAGRSAEEIERPYRRSQELGAGRAAGQALLLAQALFGALNELPALHRQLANDRSTSRLFRSAWRLLTGSPREPTAVRGGTLAIHWTQFLLLPGSAYKLSEISRQAGRLLSRFA